MWLGLLQDCTQNEGTLSDSSLSLCGVDGSVVPGLPAHLFFSSLSSHLCSVEEKSALGVYVCLSSSCTLRVTSCCLATKLHFQGRIWLVQMEPDVSLDLIYNRPGSSITNKVARSPLSWKSNSLWSLRNGRYSNRFLLKQFKLMPNVMQSWVRELTSWSEEHVPANQKPLGFGNFWDLSL